MLFNFRPLLYSILFTLLATAAIPRASHIHRSRISLAQRSIGTMFRYGRHPSLARSALRFITSSNRRTSSFAIANSLNASNSRPPSSSGPFCLALTIHKPPNHSLQRFASTLEPVNLVDHKAEDKVAKEKIKPHPEEVSVDSSVHQVFHEKGTDDEEEDVEMLAGVWSDIVSNPGSMLACITVWFH